MKFLIDAQLPPLMAEVLRQKGYEARHVAEIDLATATDSAIWNLALADAWVVVTKDEDFVERLNLSAAGPQVVWVRWGKMRNRALLDAVRSTWATVVAKVAEGEALVELR